MNNIGALDLHVTLPSHIVEKRRLVRQRAMYHNVPYHVELRHYNEQQKKVENWLNAIDVTYVTCSFIGNLFNLLENHIFLHY
jgi:ABC-type uncharacterized transport system ATPase subunit